MRDFLFLTNEPMHEEKDIANRNGISESKMVRKSQNYTYIRDRAAVKQKVDQQKMTAPQRW